MTGRAVSRAEDEMRATLRLIRFSDGTLGFQGDNDPCTAGHSATFSLFSLDGEDSGCPFCTNFPGEWTAVPGSPTARYEAGDSDSFWSARERLLASRKRRAAGRAKGVRTCG
jgi:hypothetical protein